jgi:hypothetical protein
LRVLDEGFCFHFSETGEGVVVFLQKVKSFKKQKSRKLSSFADFYKTLRKNIDMKHINIKLK